ncbi:nucleotidyltransferase family protein [Herbiconiux sp. P16]|uniref:nucleotidyltransferase family protein n=1 Tax=Herbiconiux wuyangfengii TaxID=3342794 RepID=UPI0035BB1DBD
MSEVSAKLSNSAAIPLGYASVTRIAETSGIRILLIKGLVLQELGLRPPRAYADIDVLVEPARFAEFVSLLGDFGWHERVHLWLYDRIEEHSITLIHDGWPVDIDVHRYYPGFLAPAEVVFEALWARRQTFTIAATDVVGTDVVGGAAILGLHALRWLHTARNKEELSHLLTRLRADHQLAEELAELAAATGSSQTLGPIFADIGTAPRHGVAVSPKAIKSWNRRVAHPSRTGEWLTYFGQLPLRQRPRELLIVLWPPREMYLQEHPEIGRSAGALFRARSRRILHGLSGLVRAIPAGMQRS